MCCFLSDCCFEGPYRPYNGIGVGVDGVEVYVTPRPYRWSFFDWFRPVYSTPVYTRPICARPVHLTPVLVGNSCPRMMPPPLVRTPATHVSLSGRVIPGQRR